MASKEQVARVRAEMVRQDAVELADVRKDYYVSAPGQGRPAGPLSERQMRLLVDQLVGGGVKPLVLKVVEDYGR